MERIYKLKKEFNETYNDLKYCMDEFENNPTQYNRNQIIREMAVFCKAKNNYMACLRNLYLRGNNAQNLKYMKNVRR